MDSRTLVSQMEQIGVWPNEPAAQRSIQELCQQHSADARGLARELLTRDWVTAYQVNALFAGKGSQLVVGPYVVLERLGEGGMGQVFKARHRHNQNIVALKVIRPERVANPISVSRYHREVQAAQQMNHPNIVRAFESDQANGTYYLAMEFIKGVDLLSFVKHRGPLPVSQACQLLAETAQGLQHIHEHGLVHRDIKPGNLFLEEVGGSLEESAGDKPTTNLQLRSALRASRTARYQIRIVDLGLARLCEQDLRALDGQLDLTQEGAVVGTADYMAPEQARDSREADIRSDIYALGCTFYFALTGQVPFPGGTAIEKMLHHQLDEPAPIEKFRPDLPAELAAVLRRMMAKQPAERLQTPAEVAAAVAPWRGDDGTPPMAIPMETAEQPTLSDFAGLTDEPGVVVDPSAAPKRKFRLWWLLSLAVLFVAFAGMAIVLFNVLVRSMGKR
jgi:eukaryotic-like serine/threonine-protein kinase